MNRVRGRGFAARILIRSTPSCRIVVVTTPPGDRSNRLLTDKKPQIYRRSQNKLSPRTAYAHAAISFPRVPSRFRPPLGIVDANRFSCPAYLTLKLRANNRSARNDNQSRLVRVSNRATVPPLKPESAEEQHAIHARRRSSGLRNRSKLDDASRSRVLLVVGLSSRLIGVSAAQTRARIARRIPCGATVRVHPLPNSPSSFFHLPSIKLD